MWLAVVVVCVDKWSFVVAVCFLVGSTSCDRFFLFCNSSVSSFRLQLRYLDMFVKSENI